MTIKTINQFVEEIERRTEWGKYKTENLDGAHYLAMKDLQKELNDKNEVTTGPLEATTIKSSQISSANVKRPFGPVIIGKFSD